MVVRAVPLIVPAAQPRRHSSPGIDEGRARRDPIPTGLPPAWSRGPGAPLPPGLPPSLENAPVSLTPGALALYERCVQTVEPAVEKAAVRVQSFVRGHQARDSQEEVRRIEWLRFLAVEGKYADALKLAIKPAEEAAVKQMQSGDVEGGTRKLVEATTPKSAPPSPTPKVAAAAKPSFSDAIKAYDWGLGAELASSEQDRKDLADSKARVEWMAKYVKEGDVQRAKSLAITEAEVERIDWQAKYGEVAFTEAIKAYKWQVATQLATSAQQRQDVLDSKARVEHLHKHLALRDWDLALQMAITPAEEAVIAKARAQSCQS